MTDLDDDNQFSALISEQYSVQMVAFKQAKWSAERSLGPVLLSDQNLLIPTDQVTSEPVTGEPACTWASNNWQWERIFAGLAI